MNRLVSLLIIVILLTVSTRVFADETSAPERFSDGKIRISFEVTANEAPGGVHGGLDFFDGKAKVFWIGSGWLGPDRGKWGLWLAPKGPRQFTLPVESGKLVSLIAEIDFGSAAAGDESIQLWHTSAKQENEIAHLNGVNILGIDRARTFVAPGADYTLTKPEFRRETSADDLFVTRIRPLFAEKCLSCHGNDPDKLKGDYDMRSRAALLVGGESGEAAITPGKPDESLLLTAVKWEDEYLEMPPKENDRLTAEQIGWVREWIEAGAPWVEEVKTETVVDWDEEDADGRVRVRTSGGLNDDWTLRRYEPGDIWAFQPLTKQTPPKVAGVDHPVEAFLAMQLKEAGIEPAPTASRRDLLRRATYGLTGLPPTTNTFDSFDELIDELLESRRYGERMAQHWLDVVRYADTSGFARDEFRHDAHTYRTYVINAFNDDKPYDRFIKEQIAGDQLGMAGQDALAFLWMGPWEHTAMSVAAVTRQQWLDDVTNSVGVTFLGQQLQCAKCHDHKFDPIPTRDYYQMQAIFADTKHNAAKHQFKIVSQNTQPIHVLNGGALDNMGDRVDAGALSLLESTAALDFSTSPKGNRASLANWIANPKNPLTARVIVNRVWQMHFGRGLVATPNDFGKMGADPTHPELLDWLAGWFIDNGWSIKKLHRLIMTSPTYQRSGQAPDMQTAQKKDPNNELLSYFPPRRLTAEEIRDSMLSISGELNPAIGGKSFFPEINWEVAFQPRRVMGDIAPPYEPSSERAERNRRSIYAARIRSLGHPFMEVLNRPGTELSCDRRDETTVTPQVFALLHGELSHERALALANRIAQREKSTDARIRSTFAAVYGREPSDEEQLLGAEHVEKLTKLHRDHKIEVRPVPKSVTVDNVVERTGELQKRTFQLKNLANYEDDLRPWEVDAETRALADFCLVLFNSSEFLYLY